MKFIFFFIISLYSYSTESSTPLEIKCNIINSKTSIITSLENNFHRVHLMNPTENFKIYLLKSDLDRKLVKISAQNKMSLVIKSSTRDNLKIYSITNNTLKPINIFEDFFN